MAAPRVPASPGPHGGVLGAGNAFLESFTLEDLWRNSWVNPGRAGRGELPPIMHGAEGRFEADGRLTLDVAERELGVILPPLRPTSRPWAPTCRPPGPPVAAGGTVDLGGFRFTALEIRDGKIRRLRGEPLHMRTKATLRRSSRAHLHRVVRSRLCGCVPSREGLARPSARARA